MWQSYFEHATSSDDEMKKMRHLSMKSLPYFVQVWMEEDSLLDFINIRLQIPRVFIPLIILWISHIVWGKSDELLLPHEHERPCSFDLFKTLTEMMNRERLDWLQNLRKINIIYLHIENRIGKDHLSSYYMTEISAKYYTQTLIKSN